MIVVAAAQSGSGTLTDVANAFKLTSGTWISTALAYARRLFFALVKLELAWTGVTYVLQRDNLSDFVANLVLKFMGVFFFLAVLQNAPLWIPAIVNSFAQAGASIGGQTGVLDPSATFGEGLQLAEAMVVSINSPDMFSAIIPALLAVLCSIWVVAAYAVVAGQLMVTLIESYIVISAGLFFLGFSGSRWTLTFSERYIGYAISVGIKLFMLYLIIGLGQTLTAQWLTLFKPGVAASPQLYIGVAGSALVFTLLGWQIPNLAASLMNGSPSMSFGAIANTAGSMAAGAATLTGTGIGATAAISAAGVSGASYLAARATSGRDQGPSGGPRETAPVGVIAGRPEELDSYHFGPEQPSTTTTPTSGASSEPTTGDAGSSASPSSESSPPATPTSNSRPSRSTVDASRGTSKSLLDTARRISTALQNVQPPVFPNDSAGGSIQIRFKHHDAD
jgi:type IV secretion system protein TrbL